jgi:hypothetical protein
MNILYGLTQRCKVNQLPKKIKRLLQRKVRLEELAQSGEAYCTKHSEYLCVRDVNQHHCYTGNHGRTYCKYFQEVPYGK